MSLTNKNTRLHILALPHTITSNKFSHCAFTGKVLRFGPMMLSRGYEVYHYGVETSEIICSKHFDVLSKQEWNDLRRPSMKYVKPELTDEEIEEYFKDETNFVGDLGNTGTPLYKEFNRRLHDLLKQNYRSTKTDIICCPFGIGHEDALRGLDVVAVESGIGYPDSFKNFRIFESYGIMHKSLALEKKQCQFYWFVVPNYYDILEWPLNLNPDDNKIGFFGRICDVKGCHIILDIARRMPHVNFVLCGQGNPKNYLVLPNISYKLPIHGNERGEYLSSLVALLALTLFVEPFCGVNVEAQLCGTPVIAHECGAFTETIEPFKTGILCHTLEDYCYGIQKALDGGFDRQYIHDRAVKFYDMYNVAYKYEYAFDTILDVHNGNGGWYSKGTNIEKMDKYYAIKATPCLEEDSN